MTISKLPSRGLATGAVEAAMATPFGMRNRIINGAMIVDQRNGGSAVTLNAGNSYAVDRFSSVNSGSATITAQRSTTAPAGFINSLVETVTTGASASSGAVVRVLQGIEGLNVADMGWGTANAKSATLSFWVRSSLTGTFGGCIQSGSSTGNFIFQYTISSANTWEYKTITVAGPTVGTFYTNTDMGIQVTWDLGSGTDFEATANTWSTSINKWRASGNVKLSETTGSTWYITGVQLEEGSVATDFECRPYGMEFILCQRYYETGSENPTTFADQYGNATFGGVFKVDKRSTGTFSYDDTNGNSGKVARWFTGSYSTNVTPSGLSADGTKKFNGYIGGLSGGTLMKVAFNWAQNSEL